MIWSGYNHTIWFPCRNVAAYWEGVKCRVEGKACPKCSWKENSAPAEGEGRMRVWTMYQHLLTHIPTSQQRVTQQHWFWVLIHNPSLGTLVRPPPPQYFADQACSVSASDHFSLIFREPAATCEQILKLPSFNMSYLHQSHSAFIPLFTSSHHSAIRGGCRNKPLWVKW